MTKANAKQKYEMGQMVEWTSQANGNVRTKIGIVVRVLRPHYSAENVSEDYGTKSRGQRNHESYVVCVPNPDKAEFFWPRVSQLKPATRYLPLVLAKKAEKDIKVFAPPQ